MKPYNKLPTDNNAQLAFAFGLEHEEQPSLAICRLDETAGISTLHARAVMSANSLNGGYDA